MPLVPFTKMLLSALASSGVSADDAPPAEPAVVTPAVLVQAWDVVADQHVEPSGLTQRDGVFYTVSDDSDRLIFRLELGEEVAWMRPAITFNLPEDATDLDLEGIHATTDGGFFLASEKYSRVLQVSARGDATWATDSGAETGRAATLFATVNAGVEGLVVLPDDSFLLAAERQPRGLLQATKQAAGAWQWQAWRLNETRFKDALSLPRRPDYTGLSVDEAGRVFALFRNAHLIVELRLVQSEADGDRWEEVRAWSYRHLENGPSYAYSHRTFGMAEGLVVSEGKAYVILDNNATPRAQDPANRRPLLFALTLPGLEPSLP